MFNIKTTEGETLYIKEIKGCIEYHVPLNEVVRYEWCKILNRMIPIHAIEIFKAKSIITVFSENNYVEKRYLKSIAVKR